MTINGYESRLKRLMDDPQERQGLVDVLNGVPAYKAVVKGCGLTKISFTATYQNQPTCSYTSLNGPDGSITDVVEGNQTDPRNPQHISVKANDTFLYELFINKKALAEDPKKAIWNNWRNFDVPYGLVAQAFSILGLQARNRAARFVYKLIPGRN